MKKMKFFIPITVIILILGTTFVQGDYQVVAGNTFPYTVNRSYWRVKLGSDISSAAKYNIGMTSSAEGTGFVINVTSVTAATSVDYNIEIGSDVYPSSSTSMTFALMLQDLFFANILGLYFSGPWDADAVTIGPSLHGEFFFNLGNDVNNFFRDHSNSTYLTNQYTASEYVFSQINGNLDSDGDIAIFDWIIEGTIDNPYTASPFTVEGYELFKIAYNNYTSVLQGYRIELDYKGTNDGRDFEIHLEQEVTINGYTLPAFYYDKPAGLPGFEWYLSLTAFSAIIIVSVVIRKKRR